MAIIFDEVALYSVPTPTDLQLEQQTKASGFLEQIIRKFDNLGSIGLS